MTTKIECEEPLSIYDYPKTIGGCEVDVLDVIEVFLSWRDYAYARFSIGEVIQIGHVISDDQKWRARV